MENIDRVRSHVLRRDAGVSHDRDTRAHFLIYACTFVREGEGMIRTELVANLVHNIIDVEIIALRNAVGR